MKALILAAGRGRRLDELTARRNKCMVRINGRPVIEYSLSYACATDVDEIVMVVGFRAEDIINTYGTAYGGKPVRYVVQQEQKGLVHAMECSGEILGGDDFLLLLGDEVMINPRHAQLLDEFSKEEAFAICGTLEVADRELIRRTYSVVSDSDNVIYRLIEKPRNPQNHSMGTGDCVFRNEILSYIEYTPIHHERREKELPDLIQCAIDDGRVVRSFDICDRYTNINTVEDVLTAENYLDECRHHFRLPA